VKKEKITAADKDAALGRVHATTSYDDLAECDIVIEAAPENLELKLRIPARGRQADQRRVHPRVEHVVDLDHAMAAALSRPTRSSGFTSSTRCR
jgi:hypothetical protein